MVFGEYWNDPAISGNRQVNLNADKCGYPHRLVCPEIGRSPAHLSLSVQRGIISAGV
jgi:hypothetical protein